MPKTFDPYHKWLGISPKDQPPTHYRLLSIDLFESDPEVIEAAADRVMAYVKQCGVGTHGKLARKILGEITAARACLLDDVQRVAYDQQFQAKPATKAGAGTDTVKVRVRKTPTSSHRAARSPKTDSERAKSRTEPARKKSDFSPVQEGTKQRGSTAKRTTGKPTSLSSGSSSYRRRTQKDSMAIWVIVGAGACLIMVVLIGAALLYLLNSDSTSVARKDQPRSKDSVREGSAQYDTPSDASDEPDDVAYEPYTKPGESTPLEKPADDAPSDQPKLPLAVKPKTSEPNEQIPVPGLTARGKKMPTPQPSAPDEKVTTTSDTKDKSAPDPDPQSETKPQPKYPFSGLAKSFDLPALPAKAAGAETSAKPVTLGTIHVGKEQTVNLRLLGGDVVLGRSAALKLIRSIGNQQQSAWQVQLQLTGGQAEAVPVASFSLAGEQLMFAWLAEATRPEAARLRNCLLEIAVDFARKKVPLRTPRKVEAFSVEMTPRGVRTTVPVNDLPDASLLKMEITGLSGPFPKHSFEPDKTIERNGGETRIVLEGEDNSRLLAIRVSFRRGIDQVRIDARPMLRRDKKKWIAFNAKKLTQQLQALEGHRKLLESNMAILRKALEGQEAELNEAEARYQQEASDLDARLGTFRQFNGLTKKLHKAGQIHFRIFIKHGKHEIDLVRSSDATAPAQNGAPEKPPDGKKDTGDQQSAAR